jgi:hypothetical protein
VLQHAGFNQLNQNCITLHGQNFVPGWLRDLVVISMLGQLYHIHQQTSVIDYVERFAELIDQLAAYEQNMSSLLKGHGCRLDGG